MSDRSSDDQTSDVCHIYGKKWQITDIRISNNNIYCLCEKPNPLMIYTKKFRSYTCPKCGWSVFSPDINLQKKIMSGKIKLRLIESEKIAQQIRE